MDRQIKKISLHLFAFFRILNYIDFTFRRKRGYGMEKKNKTGRSILIWTVAMVMAILLAGFNGMESKAADTYTYQVAGQSWNYTVDDKNQVTITGYSGTSENVVIPGNLDG